MNKKNIIVIGILVVVVLIAMRYLSAPAIDITGSLEAAVSTPDSTDAKYIYSILQKMKEVKLDDKIFDKDDPNNTFFKLKEINITFSQQEVGRINPFSPVGSDLGAGRATTETTKK